MYYYLILNGKSIHNGFLKNLFAFFIGREHLINPIRSFDFSDGEYLYSLLQIYHSKMDLLKNVHDTGSYPTFKKNTSFDKSDFEKIEVKSHLEPVIDQNSWRLIFVSDEHALGFKPNPGNGSSLAQKKAMNESLFVRVSEKKTESIQSIESAKIVNTWDSPLDTDFDFCIGKIQKTQVDSASQVMSNWSQIVFLVDKIWSDFLAQSDSLRLTDQYFLFNFVSKTDFGLFTMIVCWGVLYLVLNNLIDFSAITEEFITFNESQLFRLQSAHNLRQVQDFGGFVYDKRFYIEGVGNVSFECKNVYDDLLDAECFVKIKNKKFRLNPDHAKVDHHSKMVFFVPEKSLENGTINEVLDFLQILRCGNGDYIQKTMSNIWDSVDSHTMNYRKVLSQMDEEIFIKFGIQMSELNARNHLRRSGNIFSNADDTDRNDEFSELKISTIDMEKTLASRSPEDLLDQLARSVQALLVWKKADKINKIQEQRLQVKIDTILNIILNLQESFHHANGTKLQMRDTIEELQQQRKRLEEALELKSLEIKEILLKFDEMENSAKSFKNKLRKMKKEKQQWEQTITHLETNIYETKEQNAKIKLSNAKLQNEKQRLMDKLEKREQEKLRVESRNREIQALYKHHSNSQWAGPQADYQFHSALDVVNEEKTSSEAGSRDKHLQKTDPMFERFYSRTDDDANRVRTSNLVHAESPRSSPAHPNDVGNNQIISKLDSILDLMKKTRSEEVDRMGLYAVLNKLQSLKFPNSLSEDLRTNEIELIRKSNCDDEENLKNKYKSLKQILTHSNQQNLKYKQICEQYQNQIEQMLYLHSQRNSKRHIEAEKRSSEYRVNQSINFELKKNNESEGLPDTEYRIRYRVPSSESFDKE